MASRVTPIPLLQNPKVPPKRHTRGMGTVALVIMSRHHVMSSCHAMWSCHAIIPCHHSMSCHHVMSSCHAMWSCRAIMPRHHAMSCGSGDRRHMWLYIDVPSCVCPRVVYVYDHMARQLQVNTEPVYVSVCFDQACLCLCVCPPVCALVWCRSYGGGGGGPRVRKLRGRGRQTEGECPAHRRQQTREKDRRR